MKFLTFFTLLFVTATSVFANDAILRVNCQPQDAGSKVYINGVLKGECPVDIMLNAGPVTLEVKKTVDAEYVQYFKQQFTVYAGVAKRVIVTLSEPQLTPAAKKAREIAAMIQKKKEAEAQKKREIAAFQRDKKMAEAGNTNAMDALANYYETGTGTQKDPVKASAWRLKAKTTREEVAEKARLAQERATAERDLKAAKAGNSSAMLKTAEHYANGQGVEKDESLAKEWRQKYQVARKRNKLQSKLNAVSYTQWIEFSREMNKETARQEGDLFACSVSPIQFAFGLALDIVSTPGKMTYQLMLKKELNSHATVWAKPDAMIAKAYAQQQALNQKIASR